MISDISKYSTIYPLELGMQEKCYLQNYWFYYIYQEETEQKEAQREIFHNLLLVQKEKRWHSTTFWMKISTELFFYYLISFIIIFLNDTLDLSSCACSPIYPSVILLPVNSVTFCPFMITV